MLFGSRAWQKGETDGIILVTPSQVDTERKMKKRVKDALDLYEAADVKW